MTDPTWTAVDRHLTDTLHTPDAVLDEVLRSSEAAGLPAISVSAPQGKLLHLLATLRNAQRILEVGTLGGYSTIWMARALSTRGRLVTLEIDPKCADVARANFARAGLEGVIELRLGAALDSLAALVEEGAAPFDLVFIDADKQNNPAYFDYALRLSRPGTLILVDNVVRDGRVLNADSVDAAIQGTRKVLERIASEPRVSATAIQTVGMKGYDGFAIALVNA